ncbi:MAG TPA: filamentous hemagglutinin family protein, partial [Herbaspirillum sp.]
MRTCIQGKAIQDNKVIRMFELAPIARAIALTLAAGGAISSGGAYAAQPFSPGWYAAKGALQSSAAATGFLPNGTPASAFNPAGQQQAANAQLKTSIANLSLAAHGIAAMQAAQAAARAAAMGNPSAVPNGLGVGGLDAGSLASSWVNVNAPTQSMTADGKTLVDIQQTADKAIANWNTFNVGRNTIVQFDQASADWVILNRITDPSLAPSQIQGQIRAPGTVLILNKNGIIFSGSSQVNVRNLVAGAAEITDSQFKNSGIYSTQTGGVYTPSFTNASGNLVVEAGAQISTSAPASVTQGGGYVLLMGQNVNNAGDIETPKGQVALAAGDNFIIRKGLGTDSNATSTTRGNEISPQLNAGSTAGQVINSGLLVAREGDVTLAGHDVQQNAVAVATTTVNARGTIHLLNSASDATGQVTMGSAATTAILIDDDGKTTALDSQHDALSTLTGNALATGQFDNLSSLADRRDESRVEIVSGGDVDFEGGSITLATGGQIAVSAAKRAFVADGARLDVAGAVGVQVAMDSNNLLINVQGNELRDAPVDRDGGTLANSNIWVDTSGLLYVPAGVGGDPNERWYTAGGLLEVSGYLGNQGHRIGEWAAVGGTVALSGNEVVTQAGSQINISGGSIDTATGYMKTTWLKGPNGQLYNASTAPADLMYSGVYKGFDVTHGRWGDTATVSFYNPLIAPQQVLRNGYTVGRDAGQLIVSTPTGVLEGDLVAAVYNGPQQSGARANGVIDGYKLSHDTVALEGKLVVGQYTALGLVGGVDSDVKVGDIGDITQGMGEGDALSAGRTNTIWLDADWLNAQNLGGLTLISKDNIAIDAALTLATGGQLTLTGPNIDVGADITVHGGAVNMGNEMLTRLISTQTPFWQALNDAFGHSQITIDNNAKIDLSGLWLNQLDGSERDASGLAFLNGGTLNVATTGGVTFAAGSTIDVSSGAAILASGKVQGGKGGNVSLVANDDSHLASISPTNSASLTVDGKIVAYGFNGGGTLTLKAGQTIVIGDDASLTGGTLAAGTPAATSVRLAQDVVIPAGGTMPFDYTLFTSGASPVLIASYKTGDVLSAPVTLPAGTVAPIGTQFVGVVAIEPVLALNTDIFNSGFTNYVVGSNTGMEITGKIAAAVPVYRFSAASSSAPTGSRIADAADLWLPPTYIDNPVADRFTQRTGASLTLSSVYDFNLMRSGSITVDPGQNVTIYDARQTTIDGTITAHGGGITVVGVPTPGSGISYGGSAGILTPTRSIWIGEDGALDVSAQATVGIDESGRHYGVVPNGGSITLGGSAGGASDAFIIVRPGAVLDASGAAGMIDVRSPSGSQPTMVASDGGAISLYSASGIYLDGELRAVAGGAGASGGLLSLGMLSHNYVTAYTAPAAAIYEAGSIPAEMQTLRNITIVQDDRPTGLSANLAPGESDPALKFGDAVISVDQIHAGGFDQLALATRDLFVFSGNVDLAMNRSIVLSGGMIAASSGDPQGSVHLAAPYVKLDGWTNDPSTTIAGAGAYFPGLNTIRGPSLNTASGSSFTVDADLIDVSSTVQFGVHALQGSGQIYAGDASHPAISAQDPVLDNESNHTSGPHIVDAPGFDSVVLNSSGDIRIGTGALTAGKNLVIEAAQIYPLSGATAIITAGQYLGVNGSGGIDRIFFDPTGIITIRKNVEETPEVPASVFGNLALVAPNIDQGGIVRAPLGIIAFNTLFGNSVNNLSGMNIFFRDGSLTSTSANGLNIPFGGTSDGASYAGADGTIKDLGSIIVNVNSTSRVETGLMVNGTNIVGEAGAVLDVSGGGNLAGAGFVSGRGGSINILTAPLINANPANVFSATGNKVYAIVPGYASGYAPAIATNGAGDPAIGQQITIPAGVPGLPAGTYTLLPSSYALMPGAYRVELGGKAQAASAPIGLPNGSVLASGYLGFANTAIHDTLPTQIILTDGQTVRTYSQYNETGYADFLRTQSDLFGGVRPRLPIDGGIVEFGLGIPSSGQALSFAGTALFNGVDGGIAGPLAIRTTDGTGIIDITAQGQAAAAGHVTVSSDDINAFNAATLMIGGDTTYYNDSGNGTGGRIYFTGNATVNVLDGATLRAGQIFLVGSTVNVADGATLDTRGLGSSGVDSTLGYIYGNTSSEVTTRTGPAVLAVANGWFNFLPFVGSGNLNVASGASLLTEGSIVLGAAGSLTMGDVNFGARYLSVSQNTVNVGTDASLAAAQAAGQLPAGWNLTQSALDRLLHPSSTAGLPALEQLTIVAGGSINFIGDVSLDARSQSADGNVQFVVDTPALYGLADAGEGAHIAADAFVWNGIRTGNGRDTSSGGAIPYGSQDPAAIVANGPGTGLGTLDIAAKTVLFGYGDHTRPTDGASLNRYAIGFSTVNIGASDMLTTNSDGALFVGQSRDVSGNVQGGNLNITTPLITAQQGAVMAFNAGGAVVVAAPAGSAPANAGNVNDIGGMVSFKGDSIVFDTVAALPSGKLTLDAVNDIAIGDRAVIDLSGRHLTFFDKSADSWGGDLMLQSAHGNISQEGGSLIDVSAQNNVAGTITASAVDAANGSVLFDGALKGAATGDYASGEFTVQAQTLGDFAALNAKLNDAGFFGVRSFDIKRGDLVIGNEVKANSVSISVDGGSLTVNGAIDASGAKPGTIRLAARDDLTLASSAVLDTHSTALQTDSYGAPIEADNTAHVELASASGSVNLNGGATIDMRSADNVARGKFEIDAPRVGADDIGINAGAALNIAGASSIAVNGFRTYTLPDGSTIDQAYLDGLNTDSVAFMNGAQANSALAGRLAGLSAYGSAFHLRPGVEIMSDGALATSGDLDFAAYRYGPDANPAVLGSGEPGKLVIRAAGDLKINGSITDGFAPPPDTPDKNGFQTIVPRSISTDGSFLSSNPLLAESWTIPSDSYYVDGIVFVFDTAGNFYMPGDTIPAGATIDTSISFGWEAGLPIPALAIPGAPRPVYALAQPLAPGSMSWSMRLVSGADTGAADSRILRSASDLNGAGNMALSDLHVGGSDNNALASVIRTGTGDLELLAGGNYSQASPYGVYTAGTPIAETGTAANAPYNSGRGRVDDGSPSGSVLGGLYDENTLGPQYMYYMEHGGDLLLTAQGNIGGALSFDSAQVGGWLWRQGGAELDQQTAWGINFGSYTAGLSTSSGALYVHLSTFSGVGTLGGGNVAVRAGGDIGDAGSGLVIAVGGSGRVMADGSLVQTGGGTLSVKAGGNIGSGGNEFVNLRGDSSVATGDFGSLYDVGFGFNGSTDPRPADTLKSYDIKTNVGGSFVPGDGVIDIRARGDLAMGAILDPGRVGVTQQTDASATLGGEAATWFTLWTQNTALNIFGAGGIVSPFTPFQGSNITQGSNANSTIFLPSILRVTAGNGDIYILPGQNGSSLMMPLPEGELQLLAAGSIIQPYDQGFAIGALSTSLSSLATPFHPGWATFTTSNTSSTLALSNYWSDPATSLDGFSQWKAYGFSYGSDTSGYGGIGGNPFVFGPNTVSNASAFGAGATSGPTSSIYAAGGDILNLVYGEVFVGAQLINSQNVFTDYYRAAKPVQMLAGGDIVDLKGLILQNDPNDVSVIAASGNVVYAGVSVSNSRTGLMDAGLKIAGPGTLEVTAGKNLYEGSTAAIESIGPLVSGDNRPGAGIVLQAGVGAGAPGEGQVDWNAFARLYLDPANLAGSGPLADQPGKVAKTYNSELVGWLQNRFGYAGSANEALAYFLGLPAAQQRIFLRTVYYAELTAGGREFNDANGPRTGSYLRGREAIAELFPDEGAYQGNITAFTAGTGGAPGSVTYKVVSGFVHTDFGGDIQLLAPGGGVTIGSEGITPGADSGLITQGQGNIQIYSKDSLLLGLSRIMTTFGGDILAWSAEGDINAGRGSKTTVVFTPPKRTYDDIGDVVVSPQVPSTGAGIATLAPIPEVPSGDVDLIAPLGTIDAGEAGIRVSGNVNLAALQVANAANIEVKGKSTGLPLLASVNVGALAN